MRMETESSRETAATMRPSRRRHFQVSGLALRVFIALVLSWVLVMIFFGASAVSH
ncbi:hypothetical protein [Ktedonospora formicarum]|uniref:Uncharacterized protein n=1 Tax=Ktedonospora formicarum TaxID=2778364 RepID=A0A8J3ID70_9CHLR|nr:hypothetical protein [Ktedonospora formicarum]GHO50088.1 hypothetical protein KSX_82510 [Ktedonospora formicarum]